MPKQITWMQGFDHLPVYPPASASVFNDTIKRLSLLPEWVVSSTVSGGMATASVQGITYQGIAFGLPSGTNFSLKRKIQFTDERYTNKRLHICVRVSASDTTGNSTLAYISDGTSSSMAAYLKSPASGGAVSIFVEAVFDFGTKQGWLFGNGLLAGTYKFSMNIFNLGLADAPSSPYNNANKVGLVYSDFIIAVEDSSSEEPITYGSVAVASCPVSALSGDDGFYNTIDGDIPLGLNTFFDSTYQEAGGYLHVPSTEGIITYDQPVKAVEGDVLAMQVQSMVSNNTPEYELNQNLYSGGTRQQVSESEYYSDGATQMAHISVFNPTTPIAIDQAIAMTANINAGKG